jgi:hypothetical protein
MLSEWFEKPVCKIGFEDVKYAIEHPSHYLIINTLPASEQGCLIKNTLPCMVEETTINEKIAQFQMRKCCIILYGRNSADNTMDKKYKQLCSLGFTNVYIYCGGLFEWLLLQDIYGNSEFPTTTKELDILKYRSPKQFDISFTVPRIGY